MKAERNYPRYTVTAKAEAAILRGHPWVYDAEITATEGQAENGGLVDVISKKGRYLGTGFLSEQSKIRVRLVSRNANDQFDAAFWRRKLQWAWEYRKRVMSPEDLDACRIIFGEADAFPGITENGVKYLVDVENGQKTGFFLDQKYNRRAVGRIARGRTVLDCFTHTGSFALNAAMGGAKHVTAVDVSESAVEMARANAARNGLTGAVDCVAANVFDLLPALEKEPKRYDFIILDPPAFTKSRRTVANAISGYKEINYRAMKLLPRGGLLATCSCSHFATEEKFAAMLHSAARDAGVQLRQIEARQQACDHPILWGVEETNYLKFYLFQVV